MDGSILRALNDKVYDKRKLGAIELERVIRDHVREGNDDKVRAIIEQLCGEFAYAVHQPHARNGGLIGLAAAAIALGPELPNHLREIVPPVLACFADQDARVRYYACESMYNIAKVAKGEVLVYFNHIFDALCKLGADSELSVKNGAELLDRLIKDIVAESAASYVSIVPQQRPASDEGKAATSSDSGIDAPGITTAFSLPKFIPLLRQRINVINPFTRTFLVSWIVLLDSIPDLELVVYLPEFMAGLLKFLGDSNRDVHTATQSCLDKFLNEIKRISRVQKGIAVSKRSKENAKRKRDDESLDSCHIDGEDADDDANTDGNIDAHHHPAGLNLADGEPRPRIDTQQHNAAHQEHGRSGDDGNHDRKANHDDNHVDGDAADDVEKASNDAVEGIDDNEDNHHHVDHHHHSHSHGHGHDDNDDDDDDNVENEDEDDDDDVSDLDDNGSSVEDDWIPGQDVQINYKAILAILSDALSQTDISAGTYFHIYHSSSPDVRRDGQDDKSNVRKHAVRSSHRTSSEEDCTLESLKWILEFLNICPDDVLPFTPKILTHLLPAMASDVEPIRQAAVRVNTALMGHVMSLADEGSPPCSAPQPPKHVKPTHTPHVSQSRLPVAQLSERVDTGKWAAPSPREGDGSISLRPNTSIPALPHSPSLSQSQSQQPQPQTQTQTQTQTQSQPQPALDYAAAVNSLTLLFLNEQEATRVAALSWLLMLHRKAPDKVLAFNDGTFPALLKTLSDSAEAVVTKDLQLLCQIAVNSNDSYFHNFMVNLMQLFSTDRKLLETRGNLIIRQLCMTLSPERIYRIMADCIEKEEDIEFASIMVQNLNNNLITAPELADLRKRLRNLDTRDGQTFFIALFRSWCYNSVATFSLCLLAQAYEQAYNLLLIFADFEMTVTTLIQIDKLVQLLESPVFTFLRLQLLEPERYPYLYKCLYGLLMLLPQSSAFAALKNRLNSVSSIGYLHLPLPKPQPPTSMTSFSERSSARLLKTRDDSTAPGSTIIRWGELLEKFRSVQERSRRTPNGPGNTSNNNNNAVPTTSGSGASGAGRRHLIDDNPGLVELRIIDDMATPRATTPNPPHGNSLLSAAAKGARSTTEMLSSSMPRRAGRVSGVGAASGDGGPAAMNPAQQTLGANRGDVMLQQRLQPGSLLAAQSSTQSFAQNKDRRGRSGLSKQLGRLTGGVTGKNKKIP